MSLTTLQNGSDIRGVALAGVEDEPVTLTPEAVARIAAAFSLWLQETAQLDEPRICIGHDSRLSAAPLKAAACEGIQSRGGVVLDAGLATTPSLFMATQFEAVQCDGAIMLTASHLPANRNGMKFFTRDGGLSAESIRSILELADQLSISDDTKQIVEQVPLMECYSEHLCSLIREQSGKRRPLEGLKIIVDAGNGAGGFFVSEVLQPLGANTQGSLYLDPDGRFPNHIPNPEHPAALADLCEVVVREKADIGIIFDTDVDRAAAVDRSGVPITRNRFIALLATIALRESPGSTIVTDSVTSTGLKQWIEGLGGVHHRFKRGYRNVINEAIRLNKAGIEAPLAIETSGHGAFKENYFLDDGAYQVAKLLIELSNLNAQNSVGLESLIEGLKEPFLAKEFRVQFSGTYQEGDRILSDLTAWAKSQEAWQITPDNREGLHVTTKTGWLLIRRSLHDPQFVINMEWDVEQAAYPEEERLREKLDSYSELTF